MDLRTFENGELKRLGQFVGWWKSRNQADPDKFPMEMNTGAWDEQYAIFEAGEYGEQR